MRASIAIVVSLALAATALTASASQTAAPVWEAGSHFTATLHQRSNLWRLHPADGQDLAVTVPPGCGDAPAIPEGVWLLVHRGDGLVLQAPSSVPLPDGHEGAVEVRGCGGGDDALHLPAQLLDLLAEHTGAIHVAD